MIKNFKIIVGGYCHKLNKTSENVFSELKAEQLFELMQGRNVEVEAFDEKGVLRHWYLADPTRVGDALVISVLPEVPDMKETEKRKIADEYYDAFGDEIQVAGRAAIKFLDADAIEPSFEKKFAGIECEDPDTVEIPNIKVSNPVWPSNFNASEDCDINSIIVL